MKWKTLLRLAVLPAALLQACKPETIGYLNDQLRYNVGELQAVQGTAASTPALIANGSSTPMTVALLQVRDKQTGEAVPEFLVPHDYSVYLGEVGADVTTLEQLNALIGTQTSPAITVNEIGGKVVLTPSTEHVEPGLYTIDLEVTNISGTKTYNDILDINLVGMKPDSIFSSSANSTAIGIETVPVSLSGSNFSTTIEHVPTGEDKVIFMWLDKDGRKFNPKEGEIIRRALLPSFHDWSPFYEEELTDTALVYPYPYLAGLPYPVKTISRVGTSNYTDLASNYRIDGQFVNLGRNINTATVARFYKSGTHIIRMQFHDLTRVRSKVTTITNDVILPEGAGYAATQVVLDKDEVVAALELPYDQIAGLLNTDLLYYAIEPDGTLNPTSTAAAPGNWFDEKGAVTTWGNGSRLYSELNINDMIFNIGQFPELNVAGDSFVLKQSLIYNSGLGLKQVIFVFNIKVQ